MRRSVTLFPQNVKVNNPVLMDVVRSASEQILDVRRRYEALSTRSRRHHNRVMLDRGPVETSEELIAVDKEIADIQPVVTGCGPNRERTGPIRGILS